MESEKMVTSSVPNDLKQHPFDARKLFLALESYFFRFSISYFGNNVYICIVFFVTQLLFAHFSNESPPRKREPRADKFRMKYAHTA